MKEAKDRLLGAFWVGVEKSAWHFPSTMLFVEALRLVTLYYLRLAVLPSYLSLSRHKIKQKRLPYACNILRLLGEPLANRAIL
jgi:hypothetical protein